ncbi:MAG: squalene/phytoene synthase family protein [Rhodospirillales bacterium]
MASALSYMAEETRRQDRDRFLCTLFAPEDAREGLFTLLAFNAEIAKSREVVSEPLLGEIRLQWWRDAIERIYADPAGNFDDHAIVAGVAKIINHDNLSRSLFDQLINARSRDMIDEPPKNDTELREYAVGTVGRLNALMLELLQPSGTQRSENLAEASEHVSVAWALTGIIRASSILSKYKRIFMPQSLMQDCGFDTYTFQAQKPTPEIRSAIKHMVEIARAEIGHARSKLGGKIDKRYRAIFLQASLAELFLNRIENRDFNPFDVKIEKGRAGRQMMLTFKAVRGSF